MNNITKNIISVKIWILLLSSLFFSNLVKSAKLSPKSIYNLSQEYKYTNYIWQPLPSGPYTERAKRGKKGLGLETKESLKEVARNKRKLNGEAELGELRENYAAFMLGLSINQMPAIKTLNKEKTATFVQVSYQKTYTISTEELLIEEYRFGILSVFIYLIEYSILENKNHLEVHNYYQEVRAIYEKLTDLYEYDGKEVIKGYSQGVNELRAIQTKINKATKVPEAPCWLFTGYLLSEYVENKISNEGSKFVI